jgi:hypothetical protein
MNQGYDEAGMRRLLVAILTRALEDLNRPKYEEEVRAFLNSKQLDWVVSSLDLSPDKVREQVERGIDPSYLKGFRRANQASVGSLLEQRARELSAAQGNGSYLS